MLCHTQEKNSQALIVEKSQSPENFIQENTRITRRVFEVIQVSNDAIETGIRFTQPFRYQQLEYRGNTIVLDVGHNTMSVKRVLNDARRDFGKVTTFLGVSLGKNPEEIIKSVFEECECVYGISTSHCRIFDHAVIAESARKIGFEMKRIEM